jgi:hypothetical protein
MDNVTREKAARGAQGGFVNGTTNANEMSANDKATLASTLTNGDYVARVRTRSGDYGIIRWFKDGMLFNTYKSKTFTNAKAQQFVQVMIDIEEGKPAPTSVDVSPATASIAIAATQQLTAVVTPAEALQTVTWSTSDAAIATVDEDGLVTGVAIGVKATGTLTSTGTNPADAATVTIGSTVYRFKDTTAAAYDVKIGASAAVTLDNLKAAINASGTGDGSDYHTGTLIHPTVTATTNTDTTQVLEAKTAGSAGNAIATTETSTTYSFGAATLTGGTGPVAVITATTVTGPTTTDTSSVTVTVS